MLNNISIHGRLTKHPELKTTQSGVSVCSVTVAVDRSFARQGEEKQTDFFEVVFWRGQAETVSRCLLQGSEILVHGSMQSRKWQDKDGNNRISWELQADSFDFCGKKDSQARPEYTRPAASGDIDVSADDDFKPVEDNDLPF